MYINNNIAACSKRFFKHPVVLTCYFDQAYFSLSKFFITLELHNCNIDVNEKSWKISFIMHFQVIIKTLVIFHKLKFVDESKIDIYFPKRWWVSTCHGQQILACRHESSPARPPAWRDLRPPVRLLPERLRDSISIGFLWHWGTSQVLLLWKCWFSFNFSLFSSHLD